MAIKNLYGLTDDGEKVFVGTFNIGKKITLPSYMGISGDCYVQVDDGELIAGDTWATINSGKTINADSIKFIRKDSQAALYNNYITFMNIYSSGNFNYEISKYGESSVESGTTDSLSSGSRTVYIYYILITFIDDVTFSPDSIAVSRVSYGALP